MGKPKAVDRDISTALEAFRLGFTFTRSFTHPYLAEQVGPLWVLRDGPRERGNYRVEEWVACGQTPLEVHKLAAKNTRDRYTICYLLPTGESDLLIREEFKELGYRLQTTEALMTHSLKRIPRFKSPATIKQVTTQESLDRVNKFARSRQILPQHLTDDPPMRQYIAMIDNQIVGRAGSIVTGPTTWVSNMYVAPEHRRQGIAKSMLRRLLFDDRKAGSTKSVLLASHAGMKLYPVVGYEAIGTLYIFTPPRTKS